MTNMHFSICGFFCILLLAIVFFSKNRVKTIETRLYGFMLISSLLDVILVLIEISFGYMHLENIPINLLKFLNKIDFIHYILWPSLMFLYIFNITYEDEKKYEKIKNIILILNIVFTLTEFLLPIDIINESNGAMGVAGIGTNVVYGFAFFYFVIIIITFLLNFRKVKITKKYIPFIVLFVFMVIAMFIRSISPTLIILPAIIIYINLIMYFTIENPDMKLISQLNEAKSQAEKANSAKTDFLSSMSHEIRTPLNAIVGFSQVLSEDDIPDSAKEEVNDIISASESLLDIVNGILDISKIEANKLEIIDKEYSFKKVFDELVALTKARMGDKPLDFRYHYDETIPDILYGDNVRVKQVILNLLTNSVKYTKQGFVDFKVNSILKDDVCRLIISVEDSGIGIKKENIEKLFTKFERFDEKNTTIEGTGLGLAITKKLVNLMNGKIVVQSVYGKGSRFTIAIDQKVVKGKTLEDIGQKVASEFRDFDATGLRILVVDDNKLNLKVASRLLTNYKSEIITIDNGFEVIDRIKNGEKFDLILMDDMMPKMSGVETLHKLKEIENYNIPTIALTANAIEGMREKYLNEGFDDYLSKPIDKLELNKVINKYLNKN